MKMFIGFKSRCTNLWAAIDLNPLIILEIKLITVVSGNFFLAVSKSASVPFLHNSVMM